MSFYVIGMGVIVPLLVSLILVAWIHPYIVRMATLKDIVDNPDARKLQKNPVPVLGGFAVYWGLVVGVGLTSMFFNSYALFTSIVAITVMMYIGILDDILGLSPTLRLVLEMAFIGFVIWMDQVSINNLHGLLGIYDIPLYWSVPLCIFGGVGIINSINMIDGVDGLSSGFCVMACAIFGTAFFLSKDGTMTVLAALCLGSLLPFFFHNVFGQKSKMFIGDGGTLMMGMVMTIFVMHIIDRGSRVTYNFTNLGAIAFPLSVLSVPVFDTLRVMTGRIMKGISPFHADKSHLHHLFIEMGFSHIGTTFCVLSLNFFNVLCWLATYQLGGGAMYQLVVVVFVGFMITTGFYYVVRRLNHEHWPYKALKQMAKWSHVETGPMFYWVRRMVDKW